MDLDQYLHAKLEELREENLLRELREASHCSSSIRVRGTPVINFASNDYLGLAESKEIKEAIKSAADKYGGGSGASRLLAGSLEIHHELETALATFKQAESALLFSSGFACALGVLPALAGSDGIIIIDKLAHASLIDGAKLSGAKLRVFRHNDLEDLESKLEWARNQNTKAPVLVVTESLFSMDGDAAPLPEIIELKDKYGAWLFLDEAHSTGVLGPGGRGLAHEYKIAHRVDVQMGTLGKALGTSGGFICGNRNLVVHLLNRARSFIYSTAPSPVISAGTLAALKVAGGKTGDDLRTHLRNLIDLFFEYSRARSGSQIIPWIIGSESRALEAGRRLFEAGFFAPAIRYPTVARGSARIRFSLSAGHSTEEIKQLCNFLSKELPLTSIEKSG